MAYQALYRVWRPQKFSDMVGQEIITKTLKNAIVSGQTSHAYLFTGPRGTGKTSAAKIFAKALNCLNLVDGEPCNECKNCRAINEDALNDVIEIDAASNNGVEEIRDIRDKVKYAPTQAPYKVYIIDEVHMLSTGAFNALLKTLEEPPAQVVFILATTEPHKIPLTIISRTQRFDFRRIDTNASIARMEYILEQKHYQYEATALKVIANAAEGGMRDALSILDQTLSFGDDVVTIDNALLVTGAIKQDLLNQYVTALIGHDVNASLKVLQAILQEGKDAHRLIEDLIAYLRDLLLQNQAPEMITLIPDEQFKKLSTQVNTDYVYKAINILSDVQQQLRYTTHTDVYLEVLTVKLANLNTNLVAEPTNNQSRSNDVAPANNKPKVTNLKRVDQTPQMINDAKQTTSDVIPEVSSNAITTAIKQPQIPKLTDTVVGPATPITNPATPGNIKFTGESVFDILGKATREALQNSEASYNDLMQMLSIIEAAKMNQATPVAASPDGIVLAFEQPYIHHLVQQDSGLQTHLVTALNRLTGQTPVIVLITQDQWHQLRNSYVTQYKEKIPVHEMTVPQLAQLNIEKAPPMINEIVTENEVFPRYEHEEIPENKEESPIVTEAKELFGDIVTIEKN